MHSSSGGLGAQQRDVPGGGDGLDERVAPRGDGRLAAGGARPQPGQGGAHPERVVPERPGGGRARQVPVRQPGVQRRRAGDAPGDLLHLDIKGMTRFSEVSLRGDGRLRGKRKHPGFLALHVAVDDHSRLAFTQLLPDQKAESTIAFLHSAVDFFARHGIGVRALLTDNGSSYRSTRFRAACQNLQLQHRRTRPYTPRTNGKAERFIQTALREWAYARHWTDSDQRDAYLLPWTHYYNHERPHGSLSYKPPISRSEVGTTS